MVKRIVISIIIIMIIGSINAYAFDAILNIPIDNQFQLQNNITNEEDDTSDNASENTNINNSINTDTNENQNTNTDNNVENETDNNKNENEDNKKDTEEGSKQDTSKKPTQSSSNIVEKVKSDEANLKELKIDIEGLTPDFDKDVTEYYLVVDLSVEQVKVTAKPVDTNAKVTVTGNKNLEEGENTITINVKAEDGTTKKYYIYVTKIDDVEMANAELESLEIEGFNLYPSFKSNIYSYNLNIDESIENINITAIPQREKATVEIEGNTNLEEGENLIKIKVTAEDETTVRTYKINTYIDSDKVEIKEESKTPAIILLVILGTCIIGLGIFLVIKNKN